MKCKIDCPVHSDTGREWEITPEGRVWPCCYYANAWDQRMVPNGESDLLFKDKVMMDLIKEDSEWNSLNTYSLEEIVEHEIYWTHLYTPGWESDNPATICEHECGVIVDSVSGAEIGGSDLRVDPHLKK